MTTRVRLGRLDDITGGTDQYGLYVSGPDGTTIIDGTSNVFKILASMTCTITVASLTFEDTTDFSLPGLGSFNETPASLAWIALALAETSARRQNPYVNSAGSVKYAATTSGGSPNSQSLVLDTLSHIDTRLSGSTLIVRFSGSNATGSSETWFAKVYILQETAL